MLCSLCPQLMRLCDVKACHFTDLHLWCYALIASSLWQPFMMLYLISYPDNHIISLTIIKMLCYFCVISLKTCMVLYYVCIMFFTMTSTSSSWKSCMMLYYESFLNYHIWGYIIYASYPRKLCCYVKPPRQKYVWCSTTTISSL